MANICDHCFNCMDAQVIGLRTIIFVIYNIKFGHLLPLGLFIFTQSWSLDLSYLKSIRHHQNLYSYSATPSPHPTLLPMPCYFHPWCFVMSKMFWKVDRILKLSHFQHPFGFLLPVLPSDQSNLNLLLYAQYQPLFSLPLINFSVNPQFKSDSLPSALSLFFAISLPIFSLFLTILLAWSPIFLQVPIWFFLILNFRAPKLSNF